MIVAPDSTDPPLPPGLHVHGPSNDVRQSLTERVERKFFIAPRRTGWALALLRTTCRWDDLYPEEQINSLYFDTADLDQHERSLSGEFSKDKVRIRWYGDGLSEATVSVWLELKSRRGLASTKQRRPAEVQAGALDFASLRRGIVPGWTLISTMAGFGFFPGKPLHPVVTVSYWRCRFMEPRTGFRVSLDTHIRSSLVMPGIGRGERELELPGAVIEVKGPSFDLPPSLRQLAEIGSSWTRYSKYSSSLEAHVSDLGGVSRLWPSGTMYVEPSTTVPKPKGEVSKCGRN